MGTLLMVLLGIVLVAATVGFIVGTTYMVIEFGPWHWHRYALRVEEELPLDPLATEKSPRQKGYRTVSTFWVHDTGVHHSAAAARAEILLEKEFPFSRPTYKVARLGWFS